MSTILIDLCLLLAFACFALMAGLRGQSWGPEGPVGLTVIVLPAVLFLGVALWALIHRGRLDWVPGGRLTQYALAVGIATGTMTAALVSFDRSGSIWTACAAAVPFPVILGCFWLLHGSGQARIMVTVILGTTGVCGWAVITGGLVVYVRSEAQRVAEASDRERQQQQEREAYDVAAFGALSENAELFQLLQYVFSPNETVQKECRERIRKRPDLDAELSALLATGWAENAASYIARFHPTPSASLAPAFAAFLERELPGWQSRLLGDPNPGKWQANLSPYFDGAARIQQAGGDLRPQLEAWRNYLRTVSGMNGISAHIQSIINSRKGD